MTDAAQAAVTRQAPASQSPVRLGGRRARISVARAMYSAEQPACSRTSAAVLASCRCHGSRADPAARSSRFSARAFTEQDDPHGRQEDQHVEQQAAVLYII